MQIYSPVKTAKICGNLPPKIRPSLNARIVQLNDNLYKLTGSSCDSSIIVYTLNYKNLIV